MRFALTRLVALMLAVMLLGTGVAAAVPEYDDFAYITDHVTLAVPQQTAICNPHEDMTTTDDNYYLTGTSDPTAELYLNGVKVPDRGIYGSWGIYAPLYMGENIFTIKQGGVTDSVTITRTEKSTVPKPTDTITKAQPTYDTAYSAGDTLELSCVAPSGADVWAQFGEIKVALTQSKKVTEGLPVTYKGSTIIGGVTAPYRMGTLTYHLRHNGKDSSVNTQGSLYLYPASTRPVVQVADSVATARHKEVGNRALRGGAVDYVAESINETTYLLGSGYQVPKESVTHLLGTGSIQNTVSGVSFSSTEHGERIMLHGTASPLATTVQLADKLSITLHNTVLGVSSIELPQSRVFTDVTITRGSNSVTLDFAIGAGKALWGNGIDYADNTTTLYAKYPPKGAGNTQKPLSGIIVGLDAGHGGTDPGAFGTARLTGPVEKDINLATALAVQKRLEGLGATVITTTYPKEGKSSFTDRMENSLKGKADFYISLHCNAGPAGGDGTKPAGTEIYHFFDRGKPLADALQRNIVAQTARKSRGVKQGTFRVTVNSLTPAVLVELGFVSNAAEYDRLCSKEDIFKTANAIGNALVELVD